MERSTCYVDIQAITTAKCDVPSSKTGLCDGNRIDLLSGPITAIGDYIIWALVCLPSSCCSLRCLAPVGMVTKR